MDSYQKIRRENENIYLKRLAKMSGERRLEITSDLYEAVKEIAKAGIKHQNPQLPQSQLKEELIKRMSK